MRIALLLALSIALSACGFHMRGSGVSERYQSVQLNTATQYSEIAKQLKQQLQAAGASIEAQGQPVNLGPVAFTTRGIAFDGNGDAVEYELEATVLLTLDGEDKTLIEKRFTTSQSYQFESDALLASNLQATELRNQLEARLATQIVRYLRFVK